MGIFSKPPDAKYFTEALTNNKTRWMAKILDANPELVSGKGTRGHESGLGWTPLHGIASIGTSAMAKLFLERGADVNARWSDGTTPLRIALNNKNKQVAKVLREHGGVE